MMSNRSIEGASTDDLVHVRRRDRTGVDEGVGTLDDELRAAKAKEIRTLGRPSLSGRMLRN